MSEHDTPSTAREEAKRRFIPNGEKITWAAADGAAGFVEGAEWALAQVREGLEGVDRLHRWIDDSELIDLPDALAVVDRLEGKQ